MKKRVSTYGDGYLSHVHPATGRIHANYRLIGAASPDYSWRHLVGGQLLPEGVARMTRG